MKALLFDKAFIKILAKYSNYSNVFSAKNIVEFLENTKINKYAIKLEEGKQLSFSSISSLRLIELETLKTYIKINLANNFIWSSKFLVKASIFFNKKLNRNLYLYINN